MMIYVLRDGQKFGPYALEDLNTFLAQGSLLPTDQAWWEGATTWVPMDQVPGVILPNMAVVPMAQPTDNDPLVAANPVVAATDASEVSMVSPGVEKKKRIIMIAGISVGVLAATCVLLFIYPGFLMNPDEIGKPILPDSGRPEDSGLQLPDISGVGPVTYSRDIKIIFDGKCVDCHGPKKKKGKLDLSNPQGLEAGAKGEPIYVVGKPEESLLVESILSSDEPMPPNDEDPPLIPLTEEEKKKIIAWIKQGAKTDN